MAAGNSLQDVRYLVDALAARWDDEPTEILVHAFAILATGRLAPAGALAERAGVSERTATEKIKNSKADMDERGNVTSLFGVGFSSTPHRVQTPASTLYTCCGLVAQTISFIIGERTHIQSCDPVSDSTVTLEVSPAGLKSVFPKSAVCTFAHRERDAIIKNPYQSFCRHVRYFESEKTAGEFIKLEKGRFLVDVDVCTQAAALLAKSAWGTK